MPRAINAPGERLTGGFFRAGKYLVLAASYQIHQFHTKANAPVGKPSVMLGIEIVQLEDSTTNLKDAKVAPDAMRIDQWYPVGGNLEMFYPSDENDNKVVKGTFVGSVKSGGIFEDSTAAQFTDALINSGYDRERWKESEAFGLTGSILVLSEVPDKKAPMAKKVDERLAKDMKEAGVEDKDRPRTVIVPSEVIDTPDDVLGAEMPKKLWPKGTPASVTPISERGKNKDTAATNGAAKTNGSAAAAATTVADDADELDEDAINQLVAEAATTVLNGEEKKMDMTLKGGMINAVSEMSGDIGPANVAKLVAVINDPASRSSILTGMGYSKSGLNWIKK